MTLVYCGIEAGTVEVEHGEEREGGICCWKETPVS